MLKNFIQRPVLATVISSILVILGVIGLFSLPIERFPDIAPPAVQVTAIYPGANAETILRSVAPSLEEAINGVDNMTYMNSTASNDGSLVISIFFTKGTDPDQAAVNVQNRVSQATSQLPPEVVQRGIVTSKQVNSLMMALGMFSENSKQYDQTFLNNYANINIIPEIKRIPGVGKAEVMGGNKEYSMRIWLDPAKMASYKLSTQEVMKKIDDQNVEAAPGKFGEASDVAFEYVIKYSGKLNKPDEYKNMVIRANPEGSFLRLKDIARVEFGSYTYNSQNRMKGHDAITILVSQLNGANSNDIQTKIKELLAKAELKYPAGVKNIVLYETQKPLLESIDQVKQTLIEAFILVFIVVFLFLQDFRSTLIPAIAVPVAIIGTFFFMQLFGFTINLLTLFALILAIGIVVDDAIVVVEAVHAKMEQKHMAPAPATLEAMHEITGAIISITLVMAAVFLPIGMMQGATGMFYKQFAFTLAFAIIISAVNALTLSPALCALFLKDLHSEERGENRLNFKDRFFLAFNAGFQKMTNRYLGSVAFLIKKKWLSLGALAAVTSITILMVNKTQTGFVPTEDVGFLAIASNLPAGSSLRRTQKVTDELRLDLEAMEQVTNVNVLNGFNLITASNSSSSANTFINLKDAKDRGLVRDIPSIMAQTQAKLDSIKAGASFVFEFPSVPGFGNIEGLDIVLQDRTGDNDFIKFSEVADSFIKKLLERKEIGVAFTTFQANYPQFSVSIDKNKAEQLGVSVKDILQTMQTFYGSSQSSDFNRFGKYYRVVAQADSKDRIDATSLNGIYVKNESGEMLPINTLVTLKKTLGPETASRYNLFNSISVKALPKKGFSSGDAIKAVEEVSKTSLPENYTIEFSGLTKEQITSGGQAVIIFILCLVFVFLLLAAQYESYILPFAVILSIPTGVFGVFAAIGLAGIENNIYVQVALIMLIGLLSKNAILIVEVAVQRRRAGHTIIQSAIEAAGLRIRPIIMTSFAFVVGMIPVIRATGPSANGNHSIGVAAAGGMLSGVVLGLFIIPVLFVAFQGLQEWFSSAKPEVKPIS
ncbi:multidrug transporter AcrB [Dyadobacter frigoris]|uniref:efflux RND transporter permease subunit n=1 Tax=Dyadobacter frigoris TaxID=2576211 RepID=UPI0024A3CD72|nr:efflux RND transporter permease subunit [Dyadobacter frigoris]GLU55234.1 multidrug transporter AcrB [Dyadobacter frigoris]